MHDVNDIFSLPSEQRLHLAEQLIASVRLDHDGFDFSPQEIEEMEAELAAIRRGEVTTVSWDEIKRQLPDR